MDIDESVAAAQVADDTNANETEELNFPEVKLNELLEDFAEIMLDDNVTDT